ncbi:PREDICTED: uncharacterized protein LOC109584009 [Amphimedon queenslandica]|uniref:Uncharacterized protein n=1 Tax=Amphimedon queenslandica TaxID=400682 RepID=A0A1X7UB78_AMPQE|nr:PREDICTED: uncharacterized protein LOC109584009 [Amphimedon queenslandica]|eukprot:XP_019855128.1 PREDICTED: uncharacterized protein LOC109584009 [Amphimedon queenslandica]
MARKDDSEVESITPDSEPLRHLLDLLNPSLSDNNLRCIEYVCEFALGVSKDQIRSQAKDAETRKVILNALFSMLPQDVAPLLLNLILTRLNYKPKNKDIRKQRSKLPAVTPDKEKEIYEQYPKLDMWLTLTIAMTSMSEDNYRELQDHVRLEVLHDSHSIDNIESRCHLLELVNNQPRPDEVNPEPVFDPSNLSNVLKWFEDCDLEYPEEIVQYQQRYEIPVPTRVKPGAISTGTGSTGTGSLEKCCLCTFFPSLCLSIAAIAALISILLVVTLHYLSRTVYQSTGNYTSSNYSVGVMRTVKIGDNYSSDVIQNLQIEALNDPNDGNFYANGTEIYKVQENDFTVSSKQLDVMSAHPFSDERPLFLGYNPFYNADGPANVNFSFMLINNNGTDCAVRMATFGSHDDFINYFDATPYKLPHDIPQNAYNFTPCLNESGTYHFSLNMTRDAFSFFVISHIMNVHLRVNISGYISEYKIQGNLSSSCILDPSCPGSEDECTRDDGGDEVWYVFGTSASRFRGKVKLSIPFRCYEEYEYHFIYLAPIGPPLVIAVYLIILCIVAFIVWSYKCVSRKLRKNNSYNARRVEVDGTV